MLESKKLIRVDWNDTKTIRVNSFDSFINGNAEDSIRPYYNSQSYREHLLEETYQNVKTIYAVYYMDDKNNICKCTTCLCESCSPCKTTVLNENKHCCCILL